MNRFSVHDYIQLLGTSFSAEVVRNNNISKVFIDLPKFRGSVLGAQIDKGVVLTVQEFEVDEVVTFSSVTTENFFKISFVMEGHYEINNHFIEHEEVKAGQCRGLFFKTKSVTTIKPLSKKIHTIDVSINTVLMRKHLYSITNDVEAREKIRLFLNSGENKIFKNTIPPSLYQILNSIQHSCDGEDLMKRLNLTSKVYELLGELANECEGILDNSTKQGFSNSMDMQKIVKAKEYLDEHISDTTTLRELSKIVCLNEFKLKKGFKEYYNTTIHSYLVDQRLCTSCKLLKEKNCPISEIAFEVGYQCPSKYIHSFRKKYGITPGQYRKVGFMNELALVG